MKTITVRGTGKVSLKPDFTIVSFVVKSLNKSYEKSLAESVSKLDSLYSALEEAGFKKEDIKTTNYSVTTEYRSGCDKNGNYKQTFAGYSCIHRLKIEFDFDSSLLGLIISVIASAIAEPELNVSFSVKDRDSVSASLLKSASENALEKARILTEASHVTLGELVSIDYSFNEISLISPTVYDNAGFMMAKCSRAESIDINPDDITASDSATFVWEIK